MRGFAAFAAWARRGVDGQLAAVVVLSAGWFVATARVVFRHLREEEAASRVVNVAGRQRMLTQRMARQALAVADGDPRAGERLALAAAEFQQTLNDLIEGASSRGLPRSSEGAREQLLAVAHRWPTFAAAVATVRGGARPSSDFREALGFIAEHADTLMAESEEVVALLDEQFEQRVGQLHHRMTVVGLSGGLLLAGTYAAVLGRMRRRAERAESEVQRKERELADRADERRDLVRRLLRASEDERRRVAADLHDGPTQELTGAAMLLEAAMHDGAAPASTLVHVSAARTYLEDAINETRRIIADLRPPLLDDLGIAEALRRAVQPAAQDFGIDVIVHSSLSGPRPDARTEVVLYRVAHEAVMNAFKHSGADRVEVEFSQDGEAFRLTVRDDGQGFEPATAMSRSGHRPLGLLGMRERIELVGGRFAVESSPGRGTTIRVEIPSPVEGRSDDASA